MKDRDAYQSKSLSALLLHHSFHFTLTLFNNPASRILQHVRLPFIAFICLQPPSPTLTHSTTPVMAVISRTEGSPSTSTSPQALLTHLTSFVLPRVQPFLTRLRTQENSRIAERRIREEQDRAYERGVERDTERVLKKRAEVSRTKLERERLLEKGERVRILKEKSSEWIKYMRYQMGPEGEFPEPSEGEQGGITRIGIKLGDGRRVVRRFRESDKVDLIYAFVECSLDVDDGEEEEGTKGRPR